MKIDWILPTLTIPILVTEFITVKNHYRESAPLIWLIEEIHWQTLAIVILIIAICTLLFALTDFTFMEVEKENGRNG